MTLKAETSNNTPRSAAVAAEPIADDYVVDEDDGQLPTIHLSAGNNGEPQTADVHMSGVSAYSFEVCTLEVAAQPVVAEPVSESLRDIDLEEGRSARNAADDDYFSSSPTTSRRAEYVSAAFHRPSSAIPFGLHLNKDDLKIIYIDENSLAGDSPFQVGDKIFSINNKQCGNMTGDAVCQLLRSLFGIVTIIVQNEGGSSDLVESMITKHSQRELSGLSLVSRNNKLMVSSLAMGQKFANSLINVGDQVVSINGISCEHLGPEEAAEIIKKAPKHVTVVARTLGQTGVVVAEESWTHPSAAAVPAQAGSSQYYDAQDQRDKSRQHTLACASCCICLFIVIKMFIVISTSAYDDD
jgi:hypothetical protein